MSTARGVVAGCAGTLALVALVAGAFMLGRESAPVSEKAESSSQQQAEPPSEQQADAGADAAIAACEAQASIRQAPDEAAIAQAQFESNRFAAEAAAANQKWEPLRAAVVKMVEIQQPAQPGTFSVAEFSAAFSDLRARCLAAGGPDLDQSR